MQFVKLAQENQIESEIRYNPSVGHREVDSQNPPDLVGWIRCDVTFL